MIFGFPTAFEIIENNFAVSSEEAWMHCKEFAQNVCIHRRRHLAHNRRHNEGYEPCGMLFHGSFYNLQERPKLPGPICNHWEECKHLSGAFLFKHTGNLTHCDVLTKNWHNSKHLSGAFLFKHTVGQSHSLRCSYQELA